MLQPVRLPILLLAVAFMPAGLLLATYSYTHSTQLSSAIFLDAEQLNQLEEATAFHDQAQSFFEQGQYLKALPLAKQAVALRESVLDPTHVDLAAALTTLGLIHGTLIQLPQAKQLLERALVIHQSAAEPRDLQIGESLTNFATVTYASGDFVQAIKTLEQSLEIRERALGPSHSDVAVTLSHLAIAQRGLSRLEGARDNAEQAITILRTANPPRPRDLAIAVNVKGNILARLGKFEDARLLLEESLHVFEQISGPDHPDVGGALAQLAMLERKQGNVVAALPLLKQALVIHEDRYGESNPEVAGILYEIGLVELAMSKVTDAERRFERAIAIQHATVGPTHPFVALSLIELAEVKRLQGDRTAAGELLQRALRIQEESLGREHTSVAQTLTRLGYLEAQRQNLSDAKSYFSRAVQIREKALGTSHRDGAASLLNLARAEHAMEQFTAARSLYERARQITQAQQGLNPGLDDKAMSRIWKMDMKGLQDYALLLATLAQDESSGPEQESAVADGFMVTQQARGWLMQAAVASALAQVSVGSDQVRGLVKRVAEIRRNRQKLWARLNELYALPDDQRSSVELSDLKRQLSQVQETLAQVNTQLKAKAPRYAELSQPETLDLKSAQGLLRADEALVSFYTLGDRVQIWLLRKGQPVLYDQVMIPRAELISKVRQIRASLISKLHPYDVMSATELYQLLFAPITSSLIGVKHLILVPDEVLLPLPFAALLTHAEGEAFRPLAELYRGKGVATRKAHAGYATLPWLAKSYPLSVLPSASALKLLRENFVPSQGQSEPFLGFGDPVLPGKGDKRGRDSVTGRGMREALKSIPELVPLPGTRDELLDIASILHANPETALFLGLDATETQVRRLNESGRLGQAKVLAFATHGLLAGEIGVGQPALVLTPPDIQTDKVDGLLSMEEILQLTLPNTDWVILSACNTAGDDGSGEGLSGLARAFYFAGAKALLVSQWSVNDEATKTLMVEIFKRYAGATSLSPAEALQAGMLALLEEGTKKPTHQYFSHPFAWAAFSLVGEGAMRNAL